MKTVISSALLGFCIVGSWWLFKSCDTAACLNQRGMNAYNIAQYEKALSDFDKAIAADKDYADSYYYRGNLYLVTNKFDQAIADFNTAISLDPEFVLALNNRGHLYFEKKDYRAALDDFSTVLEIEKDNLTALFNRANVLLLMGQNLKALEDLNHVIEVKPDFAAAYDRLALIYITAPRFQLSDREKAIEYALQAVSLSDEARFLNTLARAYLENGMRAKAIETYQKAYKNADEDFVASYKSILANKGCLHASDGEEDVIAALNFCVQNGHKI